MKTILALVFAASLVACAGGSGKFYTGQEYYYTVNGINWSCREPKAYKGGNCKPESEWDKPST
jgi:hypothetical protein